jgi:GNAT superfamily N-acetyltransferase
MSDAQLIEPPSPGSVDHLTLTRERSRTDVNRFLERHHPRGEVVGWLACFGARYQGHLVACVVIERPSARMLDDGSVVELTRYGIRDDRPENTGSWLIAHARDWAALEGYDRFIAYAGVAGNHGTVYEAAGFECDDVSMADGSGWTAHDGDRQTWDDYERRRWVDHLNGAEVVGDD